MDKPANESDSPITEKETTAVALSPDEGIAGWTQVFACFWLWFNTFGLTNAFGVFQTYYQTKFPHEKPAVISLIGSIQPFVLIFFGFFVGPLFDAGYCRSLLVAGTAITVFAYMMVSICDSYWQVMLSQGVLTGFGSCFLFIPSISILPQYFSRRKALANGVAASGSGLGGVIYPIAFRHLLKHMSFGWSVRVLAFMILGTGLIPVALIRMRIAPSTRRKVTFDYKPFFQEPAYGLWTIALLFCLAAQYTPAFFLQDYTQDKHIMSTDLASYLLPILNASSILGRTIPNLIADKYGGMNVLLPNIIAAMILTYSWIAIDSTAGCIIFAALYGFCIGAILALPPFVVASLCPDPKVMGSRQGTSLTVGSFGLLMGPPVAAAILQATGSWLNVQLFAGSMLAAATVALLVARLYVTGLRLRRIA